MQLVSQRRNEIARQVARKLPCETAALKERNAKSPHCKQSLFFLKPNVVRAMKISSWNCTCNKQKSTSSSDPVKVILERLKHFLWHLS